MRPRPARLFEDPAHRANVLRAPVTLFARRFGPDVVPEEVRATVPGYFADLLEPAAGAG